MKLPNDIKNKIEELFNSSADKQEAELLLISLWKTSLNVGPAQLARSILVLSDGKLSEIKEIIKSGFYGDPRDVIMQAERKVGNPNHYFISPFRDNKQLKPPSLLDGARVIKWAWSGLEPFGFVGNKDDSECEEIYGLAICQYENDNGIYRFSCNKNWKTVQDAWYETVEKAIEQLPDQYKKVEANWQTE